MQSRKNESIGIQLDDDDNVVLPGWDITINPDSANDGKHTTLES